MTRKTISFASSLSAKPVKKAPIKAARSPQSARPAFKAAKTNAMSRKAKNAARAFAPQPEPKLRPRGMGEQGVNWGAHATRLRKAKKAVQQTRTAKQSFNRVRTDLSQSR